MNTRFTFFPLLLATVGGFFLPSLQAAPKTVDATAYPVTKVIRNYEPIIKIGSPDYIVERHLGIADRQFADNVWGYYGFKPDLPEAQHDNCDTLVITLQQGRVVDMKLINPKAFRVLVAAAERGSLERKPIFMAKQ